MIDFITPRPSSVLTLIFFLIFAVLAVSDIFKSKIYFQRPFKAINFQRVTSINHFDLSIAIPRRFITTKWLSNHLSDQIGDQIII